MDSRRTVDSSSRTYQDFLKSNAGLTQKRPLRVEVPRQTSYELPLQASYQLPQQTSYQLTPIKHANAPNPASPFRREDALDHRVLERIEQGQRVPPGRLPHMEHQFLRYPIKEVLPNRPLPRQHVTYKTNQLTNTYNNQHNQNIQSNDGITFNYSSFVKKQTPPLSKIPVLSPMNYNSSPYKISNSNASKYGRDIQTLSKNANTNSTRLNYGQDQNPESIVKNNAEESNYQGGQHVEEKIEIQEDSVKIIPKKQNEQFKIYPSPTYNRRKKHKKMKKKQISTSSSSLSSTSSSSSEKFHSRKYRKRRRKQRRKRRFSSSTSSSSDSDQKYTKRKRRDMKGKRRYAWSSDSSSSDSPKRQTKKKNKKNKKNKKKKKKKTKNSRYSPQKSKKQSNMQGMSTSTEESEEIDSAHRRNAANSAPNVNVHATRSSREEARKVAAAAAREAKKPDEFGRYRTEYDIWHVIPWRRRPLPPEKAHIWISATTKIQICWKRFRIRQKVRKNFKSAHNAYKKIYTMKTVGPIVEDFTEEYLREEFIPDILIEILSSDIYDYSGRPLMDLWCNDAGDMVVRETVHSLSTEIVKQMLDQMVSSYMFEQHLKKQSIGIDNDFSLIFDDFMTDHLKIVAPNVVRESLSELVEEHFFQSNCDEFLADALIPECTSVVEEAYHDIFAEKIRDEIFEDVIEDEMKVCLSETLFEEERAGVEERREIDVPIIMNSCERLVGRLVLARLLQVLATRGEVLIMQGAMDSLLKMFLARKLMALLHSLKEKQRLHLANRGALSLHREITTDIGLDLLLGMLISSTEREEKMIDQRDEKYASKVLSIRSDFL